MFQLLKTFAKGYDKYMTNVGRAQARQVLLSQGDRCLEDMGISRHLLLQGVDAWPWREGEVAEVAEVASPVVEKSNRRLENRAIRELRAMSNAELADIGITRGGIVDAVRHGHRNETDFAVPQPLKKEHSAAA